MASIIMAVKSVQSGDLYKFEKVGDKLGGKLLSYEQRPDTGKGIGHVYEIENENGIIPFFASSDLQKKLRNVPLNSAVAIEFTEKTKTKSGNDFKIFEVRYGDYNEADCKALKISFDPALENIKTADEQFEQDF